MCQSHDGSIVLYEEDIPLDYLDKVVQNEMVAWDIEMSGLDWKNDMIATCQLSSFDSPVAVVRVRSTVPKNLKRLLVEPSVLKVFHFAFGDLCFLCYHWSTTADNIACTKIASKVLERDPSADHTLKGLLKKHLNIEINKNERMSNWFAGDLTSSQLLYAANDVRHLITLFRSLEQKLNDKGLLDLARKAFAHIPTRVQLEILGYSDIYPY
jgi:ribonuclease D